MSDKAIYGCVSERNFYELKVVCRDCEDTIALSDAKVLIDTGVNIDGEYLCDECLESGIKAGLYEKNYE